MFQLGSHSKDYLTEEKLKRVGFLDRNGGSDEPMWRGSMDGDNGRTIFKVDGSFT